MLFRDFVIREPNTITVTFLNQQSAFFTISPKRVCHTFSITIQETFSQ